MPSSPTSRTWSGFSVQATLSRNNIAAFDSLDTTIPLTRRLASDQLERFRNDLRRLTGANETPLGVAVSGGPDSIALLLLTAAARPGAVRAATVDHQLRSGSDQEAKMVAELCARLDVPHYILKADWNDVPATAIQEQARKERYRLLGDWAAREGLGAILIAHHVDDQAETLMMRLARGAGIKGLGAMRAVAPVPRRPEIKLLRPLLGWRRSELERICDEAGFRPIEDPSNSDEAFERARTRRFLREATWLDRSSLARSAASLGEADAALDWVADQLWRSAVVCRASEIVFTDVDVPAEILRRITTRAIAAMATEGSGDALRGRKLDGLLEALNSGRQATLRGVLCSGGVKWRFIPAPKRTRPVDKSC